MQNICAVISGSYRKHLKELYNVKCFLQNCGINVLSPVGNRAINGEEEFVLLDADRITDHKTLQDSIFAKLRISTFQVVVNQDGYLGPTTILEMGYSISLGIQILTLEPVMDPNINPYCRSFFSIFPQYQEHQKMWLSRRINA